MDDEEMKSFVQIKVAFCEVRHFYFWQILSIYPNRGSDKCTFIGAGAIATGD